MDPGPPPLDTGPLAWLAGVAGEDGAVGDLRSTALATLAFLSSGETHKHGRHKKVLREALRFMKERQGADGRFSPEQLEHALATCALAKAYALTASPLFKEPAQRGLAAPFPGDASFEAAEWMGEARREGKLAGLDTPEPAAGPPADPVLHLRFLARTGDPAFPAEYEAAKAKVLAAARPDGSFGDVVDTARAVLVLTADRRPQR